MHGFVPLPCTYMVCVVFSNVFFSLGLLLVLSVYGMYFPHIHEEFVAIASY